jgi:uncharacterized membrane protein required for colicin V production
MSVALDVIVFLIIGLTLFFVVKKGFVKSLLELLSVVCSLILAKIFAPTVSEYFYGAFKGAIGEKIEEGFCKLLESAEASSKANENIAFLIEKYNLDFFNIAEPSGAETAVGYFAESVTGIFSYCVAYLLVFVVVLVLFKLLTPLICLIFKLPVLKTLDKTLAFVLGVVLTIIYLTVFAAVMQLLMPSLSGIYPDVFGNEVISNTYVFKYLYNLEWLDILLSR